MYAMVGHFRCEKCSVHHVVMYRPGAGGVAGMVKGGLYRPGAGCVRYDEREISINPIQVTVYAHVNCCPRPQDLGIAGNVPGTVL